MKIVQGFDRLEFNKNPPFHQQIRNKLTHHDAVVPNLDPFLALHS